MFNINLFFKSKIKKVILSDKLQIFYLFLFSIFIAIFFYFIELLPSKRGLNNLIKIIFSKILFFKNESACLFFTFTFLYSILMFFIFYLIYLLNSGKLKKS
jgi:hypothetical protein